MKKTIMKAIGTLLCFVSVLSLSLFVACASSATDTTQLEDTGDINSDRRITSEDARLALRASAKLEDLDEIQTYAADVNRDGKVNTADARQILRVSARLDTFQVEVKLKPGQEYVIDSVYAKGSYRWTCTVSPETGLDMTETVEKLSMDTPEGTTPEQTYGFTAKNAGTYTAVFQFVSIGGKNVYREITYTFYVDGTQSEERA